MIDYLLGAGVILVLTIYFTRWVFRIQEQVRNQEILIDMIGQLLLKQGLTVEEVRKLIKRNK